MKTLIYFSIVAGSGSWQNEAAEVKPFTKSQNDF